MTEEKKVEPTTPTEDSPTKESLHTIRVRHKDVQLPYDELVRRAQLGTTAEALQAEKAALKQSKADYEGTMAFLEKARSDPEAGTILNEIHEAVMTGKPIPAKYRGETGESSDTDLDRGDPSPQPAMTSAQLRIEQQLNEIQKRLATEDLTKVEVQRRNVIDTLIEKDDALRGSSEAAETADALAAGLMARDSDLSADDAIALAVDRVRKTAVSVAEKKHQTRRDLNNQFPNSPSESGSPRLQVTEKFSAKDTLNGKTKAAAKAAMAKLFGGS